MLQGLALFLAFVGPCIDKARYALGPLFSQK
jgi:hypothetical protein